MKVPLSWIREFVDVKASAEDIGTLMGVRGLALEGLEAQGDDVVMDFDVTANRPDCMSVIGIAREIATAYNLPLMNPAEAGLHGDGAGGAQVAIEAPDLCGRYVAAIADVTVGPSPKWMQERLLMCGVRPISNIVDITNYVMLETGQPMHAFDLAKMREGKIIVRRAKSGETMTTLDGKKRTLTPDMLVIADAECAEDIGGVMGGASSEISNSTKRIVFEAAYFFPAQIRSTSKTLGLKTEASSRFERGADRTAPPRAMKRALELLEKINAGKPAGTVTDVYPSPYEPRAIRLDRARIGGLLGMDVPDDAVERILASLGFEVSKTQDPGPKTSESWTVIPPAWRVDMHRQVDLIEEVGRHYGFEHLPTTFPGVEQAPPPSDPRIARDRRVRTALLGMGFSEAITFAFIEAAAAQPYLNGRPPVALANPLSEKFAVMRPSLLPGLVDVAQPQPATRAARRPRLRDRHALHARRRNPRRGVRMDGTRARPITGAAPGGRWISPTSRVSSSNSRRSPRFRVTFTEAERTFLVSGRAAHILINGRVIGGLGQLSPEIGEARDLPAAERGLRRRAQSRRCHGRVAPRNATRDHTAALPVRRARRVDSRREQLVCGNGSCHHSVGRARHARAGARVRSLRRQGRSGRQGQPLVPFDVPITRADPDG